MYLTRNGVARKITASPYKLRVNYTDDYFLIFVFSSELYKEKFEERLKDNREKINGSLSHRFGFKIENNVLCDIKLYTMIEKRGFLIKNNKEGFECLKDLELNGNKVIIKN